MAARSRTDKSMPRSFLVKKAPVNCSQLTRPQFASESVSQQTSNSQRESIGLCICRRGVHQHGERLGRRICALPGSLTQLSLPSLRVLRVGKSSTSLLAGVKAGRVDVSGSRCDPMWEATPRGSMMGLISLRDWPIRSFNLNL